MSKYFRYASLLALAAGALACDDGRIYPDDPGQQTGGRVTMNVLFTGQRAWPEEYTLIMAAFDGESAMPVVSKSISRPENADEPVSVSLNGLGDRIERVTVSVANKSRQPLFDLYSYDVSNIGDREIELPVRTLDLASYGRVQRQVFDSYCIACHGGGAAAAAGLDLTAGRSHSNMVGVTAGLSPEGDPYVEPGDPSGSFLVRILKNDIVGYNHTDVLPQSELITLIETWIDNGAAE